MQCEVSRVDDATVRLSVTLTAGEVDQAIDGTYQHLAQRVKIPGFRPGKAPRNMLLQVYGEEDFYHQATLRAEQKWYPLALKESGITAIASGEIEKYDDDHSHVVPSEPFTFISVVPVMPEVELPDYGQIKIPPPPTLVTEEDVDHVIDDLRRGRATLEPAPAKAAELEDVVKITIHGQAGGQDFDQDDLNYELRGSEDEQSFPGLSKELIGSRPGDIREITLPLPGDYDVDDLAGKSMILNVVVKEVQRKVLPDLTDEFVKSISSSGTVAELRGTIRHNLEHEKNDEARNKVAAEAIDSLIARVNPSAPTVLVEEEMDRTLRRQHNRLKSAGMPFEQFLIAMNTTIESYREEQRPAAERRVKRDLLLDALAKAENIEPPEELVNATVGEISNNAAASEREYDRLTESSRIHELVAEDIRRRLAAEKLVEIVSGLKPLVARG